MYMEPKLRTQPRLTQVTKEMNVYDSNGVQLGKVRTFLLGSGEAKTEQVSEAQMVDAIQETLGYSTKLPMALYSRLYEEGFICVDRGALKRDLVVIPMQIDRILDDSIFLAVEGNALLTIYASST